MKSKDILLDIRNLSVEYKLDNYYKRALNQISFELKRGSVLGIIGESGSGKTSIALSMMKLHNKSTRVSGNIYYNDQDINNLKNSELNKIRWKDMSLVFQNHLEVLNPVLTIKEQILEVINKHLSLSNKDSINRIYELFNKVNLDKKWLNEYPHRLSGGMRQRVLIAMALACEPKVLIIDEPTTALDRLAKEEILELLLELKNKFSMILISHDMYVINKLSDNIMVMYEGEVLEKGITKEVVENPMHVYTKGLIESSLEINPYQDLWGIPEFNNDEITNNTGCVFKDRCYQSTDKCLSSKPNLKYVAIERQVACNFNGIKTLLKADNISKTYINGKNKVIGCKNCSISIRAGEIISLVGQSGSGKSTLGNILSGLLDMDSGDVFFEDLKLNKNNFTNKKNGLQIIFQDPFSSINSRFTVSEAIMEPLNILNLDPINYKKNKVIEMLKKVGLSSDESFLNRKANTLSGGQRQRVAIARALILEPKIIIADEISSMLDPSTKANMIRLLKGLQNKNGFSMLYITHELSLARKISNKILIMKDGEIIESGSVFKVFDNTKTEYGKLLLNRIK